MFHLPTELACKPVAAASNESGNPRVQAGIHAGSGRASAPLYPMPFELNTLEARILGCLLEKERHTPENYPLSLHALTAACNQSTNREPVTAYDEKTVEAGVNALREKKLASVIFGAGSRVQKYRHLLLNHFELQPPEVAVLCVLLLRGPQTPGELRQRTERMFAFASLEALQSCLDDLAIDTVPLVRLLEQRPGQKERRYAQLLAPEAAPTESAAEPVLVFAPPKDVVASEARLATAEQEIASLKTELAQLREEFATFRKQFE
jgi:uncharacterized protein YceH (UPF0502 family)